MTDNEIIKAKSLIEKLKEAYEFYWNVSKSMPYDIDTTVKESASCLENLIDIINRQKAEIEALINGNETLQKYIAEQKAEIERLQGKIELLHSDYTYKFVKEKAKAEAVKEFAERLKIATGYLFSADSIEVEIDNLVKEMVGDGK